MKARLLAILACLLALTACAGPAARTALVPLAEDQAPLSQAPLSSCGYAYYVIREDGTAVGWGDNIRCTLPAFCPTPDQAGDIMDRAIGIYGGAWVALILDEDHDLWGLGAGGEPFCLLMDTPWDAPPQLVKLLENVVTAGSGDEQAMALLEDGTIMRWGSQGVQQFLTGCTVLWVESTDGYALTEEGQLLGWGRQLPIEGMRDALYQEPQVILEDAKDLVSISSYQGIRCFLHSDGTLWRTGWDQDGNFLPLEPWRQDVIACMEHFYITSDHRLWMWDLGSEPVVLMENAAAAMDGEQGIFALDRDGVLWHVALDEARRPSLTRIMDGIRIPEHPVIQQQ